MKKDNNYSKLAEFGKELLNKTSIEEGLPLISKYAKEITGASRCSIFINDLVKKELWTTIADGVERIIVSPNEGIVGKTIVDKKPIIENNPYSNPLFLSDIDIETGYKTKNIATAPVLNPNKEVIGVVQLLNKDEDFDEKDTKFLIFFANYISGFIDIVNMYESES